MSLHHDLIGQEVSLDPEIVISAGSGNEESMQFDTEQLIHGVLLFQSRIIPNKDALGLAVGEKDLDEIVVHGTPSVAFERNQKYD